MGFHSIGAGFSPRNEARAGGDFTAEVRLVVIAAIVVGALCLVAAVVLVDHALNRGNNRADVP